MLQKLVRVLIVISLAISCCFAQTDVPLAQQKDVQRFIANMVRAHHFKKQKLIEIFNDVKLRPQVIKSMNAPLEKQPWSTYQMLFVNEWRIEHGVKYWEKHEETLKKAEKIYGVPASIIVATIGIETKYGQRTGGYRVIDSLSSLAFSDSPRAKFFRKELEEFLLLTQEEHLDPLKIKGSYAGAIGQPQFMPSSYRRYAINFSKSGKTDLLTNEVDVIGSIANYYKKHGWQSKQPIAIKTKHLEKIDQALSAKLTGYLSLKQLHNYGIKPEDKHQVPNLKMKLIELKNNFSNEYWLGFHNFDVIKRYNMSDLYAMAVFQLSSYITALKDSLNHG